jgi:hypothetical protein
MKDYKPYLRPDAFLGEISIDHHTPHNQFQKFIKDIFGKEAIEFIGFKVNKSLNPKNENCILIAYYKSQTDNDIIEKHSRIINIQEFIDCFNDVEFTIFNRSVYENLEITFKNKEFKTIESNEE